MIALPFDLTKKIGPLPTWGWLAVGGTGGAFVLYRRHQAAAVAAANGVANSADARGPRGPQGPRGPRGVPGPHAPLRRRRPPPRRLLAR